ncbi:WD40 repeat-like protein [Wallemia mellicola]|uniref:Pre-mRNA-processing factor 17 n=2 Tax=Wallemia mellicola TaxID=1708541 RepID=A0A4T0RIZ3_9BASI|nr:WD40 repeat-like protein [Wallemia mellicola]TIC35147.1 WD40 repeat-like protein [Wallemia mellicola]TIC42984.1 WD40 repeat-like protein [Wallemia mellicola]
MLVSYASDDDSEKEIPVTKNLKAAPDVETAAADEQAQALMVRPTDDQMLVNIPYEHMNNAVAGPDDPFRDKNNKPYQNLLNAHIEEQTMNDHDFMTLQRQYEGILRPDKKQRKTYAREDKGDLEVVDGDNEYRGPWAAWKDVAKPDEIEAPYEEDVEDWEIDRQKWLDDSSRSNASKTLLAQGGEKSVFHGSQLRDYQGRTYMHIPTDVDVNLYGEEGSQTNFLPKACIHTWAGHTKGVSRIKLFPGSGHLLLSASMDNKVKLWDVYNEGKCLRTFMGHYRAVKDVAFNNDGTRFLSASYDKQIKLWDTETGQCISAFTNNKSPQCITFNPDADKQDTFLAGMQDRKIIQVDLRTNEITQEYDQHLGPVNTLTFVDDNRRFVTTSDDKTMRAWDYDIPVVIKYIAEPDMHSMPAVGLHPTKKFLAAQSLDNQILIWAADTFKQNRRKRFAGHSLSGYACQLGFSPDGRYISSGDGAGNIVFWDWKTSRLLKKIKAHDRCVIDHAWLPHETSKVITASWDGAIKLWD